MYNSEFEAFKYKPLAFYLRYAAERSWVPPFSLLEEMMLPEWNVDMANKVQYVLRRGTHIAATFHPWSYTVARGLDHCDAGVRQQFPAVSPLLAVFLRRLPPRVQCRTLENAGVW